MWIIGADADEATSSEPAAGITSEDKAENPSE